MRYVAFFLLSVVGCIIAVKWSTEISSFREMVENVGFILMCVRMMLLLLIWIYWDKLVDRFYKSDSESVAYVKSRRTNYVLFLLIIELLLIQNVVGDIYRIAT